VDVGVGGAIGQRRHRHSMDGGVGGGNGRRRVDSGGTNNQWTAAAQ